MSRTRALYDRGEDLSTRVRRSKNLLFSVAQKFNTFNTFNIFDIAPKEHGSGDER